MRAIEAVSVVLPRHTSYPSIYDVPAEKLQDLLGAVNEAVNEVFDLGPERFKRTSVTQSIGTSSSATGLDIDPGATVSGNPTAFAEDERGQALVLDGDSQINEILTQDTILFPYNGTSTVNTGTIYVDTVAFFDFSVRRVVNHVKCRRNSDGYEWELYRDDEGWASNYAHGHGILDVTLHRGAWLTPQRKRRIASLPITYGCHEVGGSRNTDGDAVFLVRVDPIPTTACTLYLQIDQDPAMLTIEQLLDGTKLPLPDARAFGHFVPILADKMRGTSLWSTPDKERYVEQAANAARFQISRLNEHFAPPVMSIGTRRGY